ncbi:aldehyde dehydrogenase 3 family, memberA1 [Gonapodya prolifera JEL478]|uniref:Aldehyde dehydrogenase n=1 Tax=Gonapodya prolifera (strain JEL478) TaxID=1344416 RepID=A0A139A0W5_GONPJ|nr:aldehyde dehydrogenase 3 family, memberA1 [Gonapodya prolifera JEL478]|eukprot:KXS10420.1 aldehyde dehydrogenase 3 family, memberA1 [Gonapodya prolifera JEL478]
MSLRYNTSAEIKEAWEVVSATYRTGKTRPFPFRREQLRQLYKLINENQDAFNVAMDKDLKRNKHDTYVYEILTSLNDIADQVANIEKWGETEVIASGTFGGERVEIQYEPLGVALDIVPWNYPVFLAISTFAGIIGAGNCCILKPSELSPYTSQLFADLFPKYLDQSCYRVINGAVPETTQLLEYPFNQITYTGSTPVGKIIQSAAAKHLTPVLLELGGKSPVYVAPDADIKITALRIAVTKFFNNGQTCVTPDYILVHKKVAAAFIAELKAVVEKNYGPDPKKSADYGRVISKNHHRRIMKLLERDAAAELTFVTGGPKTADEEDRYIPPTVVTGFRTDKDYALMEGELFAPVLPVIEIGSQEEAHKFINDRPHPLAAYVFSTSAAVIAKFQKETHSGSMAANDCHITVTAPDAPFGGVGPSGMGAYHHKYGFDQFSHKKTVVIKKTSRDPLDGIRTPPGDYERTKRLVELLILKKPPSEGYLAFKKVFSRVFRPALITLAAAILYKRFGSGDVVKDITVLGATLKSLL